ncbi:purine-nucleoside phosphorylase [Candidatus Bipolaricaulota bacterium]
MSTHIGAKEGQIAPTILLPGDPLRARFIAETLLEEVFCFNEVRGMLGFTGLYGEKIVSVMGTGMGVPSHSIYVHELITEYHVKTLIRVGTCGALQPDLEIGDVVLAMAASTDSHINRLRFGGMDYAPTASFDLLLKAHEAAQAMGSTVRVGNILTSDTFYHDDPESWRHWAAFGVLVVEMETAGLYTLAAKHRVDALSILTVSDSLVTHVATSSEERERGFSRMAELALQIAP